MTFEKRFKIAFPECNLFDRIVWSEHSFEQENRYEILIPIRLNAYEIQTRCWVSRSLVTQSALNRSHKMVRSIPAMVFFSLATLILIDGRLTADEPSLDVGKKANESSVSFKRHQFKVSRQNGKILFDGTEIPKHFVETKSKEVKLIEIFDGLNFPSDRQFLQWARKLKGARTYTYDEVIRVTEDGSTNTQPLVFFDKNQRSELDSKWHVWLDMRQAELEQANRLRLAQEQEAKRYQQQAHLQELQTQTIQAQAAAAEKSAQTLAVISGATSLWEVELVPAGSSGGCSDCSPNFGGIVYGTQTYGVSFVANGGSLTSTFGGNYNFSGGSNSLYVQAYGRTSQAASYQAVQYNPGYRAGTIRKLAGY